MLAWQDGVEWARDNRWQDIGTAPEHQPVDLFARRWGVDGAHEWATRRFHGCTYDGRKWSGLPEGWHPTHWAPPMTAQRLRAAKR